MGGLIVDVGDLVGHPEARRSFSGTRPVKLRLGDAVVDGPMSVTGVVKGTVNGVIAEYEVSAVADLACVRCLTGWQAEVSIDASQHFARIADEDGYAIEDDKVDVTAPATDELALAIPAAPLCKKDCRGLCPTCGTDLNSEPCDGHGEEPDSPFAALKDLFDP